MPKNPSRSGTSNRIPSSVDLVRSVLGIMLALAWIFLTPRACAESNAWIGLVIYDISRESASETGGRIFVMMVYESSPAFSAGLRADDVIVELNGRLLSNSEELICAIAAKAPTDVVQLTAIRRGEKIAFSLALVERPPGVYASPRDCAKILSTRSRKMNVADYLYANYQRKNADELRLAQTRVHI
jgi:predicted metalloprotease with PDZ domain